MVSKTKIRAWLQAKKHLDEYKKIEGELRIEILTDLFPENQEGSVSANVGGLIVKGTFGYNYKLDAEEFEQNKDLMSPEELECVTYAPKFSKAAYRKLEDTSFIDDCLTVTPSMPSIKVEES